MWRAAGRSQAVQVSHDHHRRLPKVNSQVIILRQGQVAQEALIRSQGGREDLETTVVLIGHMFQSNTQDHRQISFY